MKVALRWIAPAVLAAASFSPTVAAGPVAGEVTALYWASNSTIDTAPSEHSYDAAARAELWFVKKLGLSVSWYRPQPEDALGQVDTMQYANLDLKWRFLSATKNNFFALGAGWQQLDAADGFADDSTAGPRVVAEGRVSFVKILYGYGRAAWLPTLKDWDLFGVPMTDGKGYEAEAGLQIKPTAFMQIFLAYRLSHTAFESVGGAVDVDHDGPVVGFGFNF
jgi:hypothetical protein